MNKKQNRLQEILKIFSSHDKTIKYEIIEAIRMSIGLNIKKGSAEKQIDKYLTENKIQIESDKFFTDFYVDRISNTNILHWKAVLPAGFGIVLTKTSAQGKKEVFSLGNANRYVDEKIKNEVKYIYELSIEKKGEASIASYDFLDREEIKKKITYDPNNSEITDNSRSDTDKEENNNPNSNKAFGNAILDTKPINKKNFRGINKKKRKVHMSEDRRVSRWLIFLLGYWAIMPIVMVILGLSFPFLPLPSEFWSVFAITASLFWVTSSLLLILVPEIFMHLEVENRQKWIINIGSICSLTIGVFGILFGSLSLLQHPMDFPYQISLIKSSVKLDLPSINKTDKTVCVFILDVSRGFINSKKQKNYNNAIEIIKLITDNDRNNNPLLMEGDKIELYVFAKSFVRIPIDKINEIEIGYNRLIDRISEELKGKKDGLKIFFGDKDDEFKGDSNFIYSLNSIYHQIKKMYSDKEKYSYVNMIIFSDFLHDIGNTQQKENDVVKDIVLIAEKIKDNPRFSLTAFKGKPVIKRQPGEIAILTYLAEELSQNRFQEIDMDEFNNRDKNNKPGTIAINLYKKESVNSPLYIGYRLSSRYFGTAELVFSETLSKKIVYIDLHKYNKNIPDVSVTLKGTGIILNTGDDGKIPIEWKPEANKKTFSLELGDGINGNRSDRYELHLSFPELGTTKIIPLVIIPFLNDSIAITILGVVLLLLLTPVVVARYWYFMLKPTTKILFLCFDNSSLSQMAEGFAKKNTWKKLDVCSAGFEEAKNIDENAIRVMRLIGVEIVNNRTKHWEEYQNENFDYVITLCRESEEHYIKCPPLSNNHVARTFKDDEQSYESVRDHIKAFIKKMPNNL